MANLFLTAFFMGVIVGGILTALTGAWLAYLYDRGKISYGQHAHETMTRIKRRIKRHR